MAKGQTFRKVFKDVVLVLLVTGFIFIPIDFLFGSSLLSIARKEGQKDSFRIKHSRYHHTLTLGYEGPAYWGPFSYNVCTNASGMKSDCQDKLRDDKNFDIAFIGDSFTEGVGVPYEDSFVGMVAKAHPELKIANLGVVSYTPTIYLKKLEDYLKRGYTFKKVIVFVDIGDIMDESIYIEDEKGNALMLSEVVHPGVVPFLKRNFKKNLPLTYEALHHLKQATSAVGLSRPQTSRSGEPANNQAISGPKVEVSSKGSNTLIDRGPNQTGKADQNQVLPTSSVNEALPAQNLVPPNRTREPWIYDRDYARSAWTYNLQSPGYGDLGVQGSINKAVSQMERVAELLKTHNISLSVGVYPWPAQLIFDNEDSLQVEIWEKFCENRCANFYNAFPLFFKSVRATGLEATIAKYYFAGDMHFNRQGNEIIAESILGARPLLQNELSR